MDTLKDRIDRLCPGFMKSLWAQLAVSYTLLAFGALMLLGSGLNAINDHHDFHAALTPANVERQLAGERLTVAQAIRDRNNAPWLEKTAAIIRAALVDMEIGGDTVIANSSRPEVYIKITDAAGRPVLTDPPAPPPAIAMRLDEPAPPGAAWIGAREAIRVAMPATDADGKAIGQLRVVFVARYDAWVQAAGIADFLSRAWVAIILCAVPIGIACGLLAAGYVRRQLQRMNMVTERWRQGDFDIRIALPNDDVLIRHSRHLNAMAEDLKMYLALKQSLAAGDERTRVARELHDTVKQKLFALGLQLAAAKTRPAVIDAAGEQIAEAEAITREAQRDLMEIITQLRPADGCGSSLHARIAAIADDFRRRFPVRVEFRHGEAVAVGAAAEHHLLRIVQEAMTNAIRHGKASTITLDSAAAGGTGTLTIADDGGGFDPAGAAGGFGVAFMRDRMRDLPKGRFEIASAPGAGTRITLSWRLDP